MEEEWGGCLIVLRVVPFCSMVLLHLNCNRYLFFFLNYPYSTYNTSIIYLPYVLQNACYSGFFSGIVVPHEKSWISPHCRSEQGLELDLFMMQCCAALAPPDLYVRRILERFGLSNYLDMNPARATEYVVIF